MILISKHNDLGKSLFDASIIETENAILIRNVYAADFPMFDITTENNAGVAQRKDSEFAISFSFLQAEVAWLNGETILNFLRSGNRSYRYHIAIQIDGYRFSGTFKSEDIKYGFTYTDEGSYKASLIVRDPLREFFEYTNTLNSDFVFSPAQEVSFENYLQFYHLQFITLNFGGRTYNERVGDDIVFQQIYHGNTGSPGYTDWTQVSRWESFYELQKGMGFDFDFVLKYSPEEIYNAELFTESLSSLYEMPIFFKTDITDDTEAITLSGVKTHDEMTVTKQNTYVWIGTRQQNPSPIPDLTIARGVLYADDVVEESDTNDAPNATPPNPGNAAYRPYFQIDDRFITWYGLSGDVEYDRTGILTIPLTLYSCNTIEAYGQYIRVGAITYSHFFVSKLANVWHLPVQRFAAQQYKRYINSQAKKGKELTVLLQDVPNIKLWRKIILTDMDGEGEYYVSNISALNWRDKTMKISLIQL